MNKITFGISTKITRPERKEYLHKCIQSILNQSDGRWELIISNDGSTIDPEIDIYQGYANIRIFQHEKSLGIFPGFNFCLENCNTKWFIPMGDDDIVKPDFVKVIISLSESYKDVNIFYFDHENIDGNDKVFQSTQLQHKEGIIEKMKIENEDINNLLWNSPASFFSVVEKDFLVKLGGYPDYGMTTDGYMSFLFSIHFKGFFLKKKLAQLRRHKYNASGSRSVITFMKERTFLLDKIIEDFGSYLNAVNVCKLEEERQKIIHGHIMNMKTFQELGRSAGISEFIVNSKKGYLSFKGIIILIIGIILGRYSQIGFNIISDIHSTIEVRLKSLKQS